MQGCLIHAGCSHGKSSSPHFSEDKAPSDGNNYENPGESWSCWLRAKALRHLPSAAYMHIVSSISMRKRWNPWCGLPHDSFIPQDKQLGQRRRHTWRMDTSVKSLPHRFRFFTAARDSAFVFAITSSSVKTTMNIPIVQAILLLWSNTLNWLNLQVDICT